MPRENLIQRNAEKRRTSPSLQNKIPRPRHSRSVRGAVARALGEDVISNKISQAPKITPPPDAEKLKTRSAFFSEIEKILSNETLTTKTMRILEIWPYLLETVTEQEVDELTEKFKQTTSFEIYDLYLELNENQKIIIVLLDTMDLVLGNEFSQYAGNSHVAGLHKNIGTCMTYLQFLYPYHLS